MTLRQKIQQEIRGHGPIRFWRYMEMCLYDPELGYYSRNVEKFGKAGDFYTSSDVHAVFGRLLSRQFEEMWRILGSPDRIEILELGPGRGLFAQDVLAWSQKKFPQFYAALHYTFAEISPALRVRLQNLFELQVLAGKVSFVEPNEEQYLNRALNPRVPIVVFANEFFDALPVEILSGKGILHVAAEGDNFVECWVPPSAFELDYLDSYSVRPEGSERVELPLVSQFAMHAVTRLVHRGFALVVDYGFTRAEQLAGRHRGTLKAIRQHSISASPYEAPGEQDITADVNFTALKAIAEESGMEVQSLITQSQFLMGIGEQNQFADAFEECRLPQERAKVALQLKHLVTPAGMGESFHVMLASRGVDAASVAKLGGMSFGRKER